MTQVLISVSDKAGLVPFAKGLEALGFQMISTGGTLRVLKENGVSVTPIDEVTGFPEMLDGRVKTLHPKIHGGLLAKWDQLDHMKTCEEHDIKMIDLVVVNLYPFEETVAKPDVTLEDAIENIDIGGPSMLRSAAKNHESVTVITDPADYDAVAAQIEAEGNTTLDLRQALAAKVYARTADYDGAIADHLMKAFGAEEAGDEGEMPQELIVQSSLAQTLRYGENPHQRAGLYGKFDEYFEQLHGKALSYNNILDATAAANLICEFLDDAPTLAILKHTNPCGMGQGASLREAWDKAFATDNQAPFGGIIAVNQPLDGGCAEAISEIFSEVIIAPEFTDEAKAILQKKKNLRLLRMLKNPFTAVAWDVRNTGAESFLVQERDIKVTTADDLQVVTEREPTDDELNAMLFGWRVVKHVKSNAIVYCGPGATLGIGAGQMSRVDSSRIAVWKAGEAGLSLDGSVVCSDAFFPFADGLIAAGEAGATAAIQPGGSVRDEEVIAAANERDIAMVFTGHRHFRH